MGGQSMFINRKSDTTLMLSALIVLAALALSFYTQPSYAQSPYTNVNEFLHPDEAFQLKVRRTPNGANGHEASWTIAPEYYLYRKIMKVQAGDKTLSINPPPGEIITDEFFGETAVFRHNVAFGFNSPTAEVEITYQGCADAGLCYTPVTKKITLAGLSSQMLSPQTAGGAAMSTSPPLQQSAQDEIFSLLRDSTLIIVLGSFLLYGILLAFTPCVLPILPILLRTLTHGGEQTTPRALALSSVYVLAFSLVYAALGVASGLLGESVQAWLQKPWLIVVFALFFVALAMSMFGLFRLQMPTAIQSRVNDFTNKNAGSGLKGSAVMGVASAIIIGPCVTPALIGALLFIAQTRDATLGAMALFAMGIGMGLPLIAFGTFFSRHMPKPGAMQDAMNVVLGFLMLGVAIWILDRLIPSGVTLLLSGAAFLVAGFSLFHLASAHDASMGANKGVAFARGVCALLALYGAILIVGAAMGGQSMVRPLATLAMGTGTGVTTQAKALPFRPIENMRALENELAHAKREKQHTMLYFYADWCVSCKELEAFTFSDARTKAELSDTKLLIADVTDDTADNKALLKRFSLFGPPGIMFFTQDAEEIRAARLVGFVSADDFVAHIKRTKQATL